MEDIRFLQLAVIQSQTLQFRFQSEGALDQQELDQCERDIEKLAPLQNILIDQMIKDYNIKEIILKTNSAIDEFLADIKEENNVNESTNQASEHKSL